MLKLLTNIMIVDTNFRISFLSVQLKLQYEQDILRFLRICFFPSIHPLNLISEFHKLIMCDVPPWCRFLPIMFIKISHKPLNSSMCAIWFGGERKKNLKSHQNFQKTICLSIWKPSRCKSKWRWGSFCVEVQVQWVFKTGAGWIIIIPL